MMRTMGKSLVLFGALSTVCAGCMTVVTISANQVPRQSERRKEISASDSGLIVLGIPFGNGFVAKAKERLMDKCPGGAIEGLLTKYQSTSYFIFADVPEVTMEGYCVKAPKKGRA